MRVSAILLVLFLVEGCTNDYGNFRFPRVHAALGDAGAREGGATDGG